MIANLSILKWWLLLFVSEHEANEAADEVSRFKGEHCRALNAYLSSVPSFSDGGDGLPTVGDGFSSSGSSVGAASNRERGRGRGR